MAIFGFPALFGLGKLIAGAFAPGIAGDVITAASALKSGWDQFNYDPKDLSLGEEVLGRVNLLNPVKGVGSLFKKPVTSGGEGGGGGGGDDGGGGAIKGDVDFFGRPFFDPGFGSPAQNIQKTDPTGGRVQPVTTENLFSPGQLSQFDSPSAPTGPDLQGGVFSFNQGGLVSLLPRRATPVRSPPISYRRY